MDNDSMEDIAKRKNKSTDPASIAIDVVKKIVYLIVLFILGNVVLYNCRVAQTNLLPTCLDYAPYTSDESLFEGFQTTVVNMNVVKEASGKRSSIKVVFDAPKNIKMINESVVSYLKNLIEGPKSNVYGLYFAKTLQMVICNNFTINNYLFNALNQLPETMIILIGPILVIILLALIIVMNMAYTVYAYFTNIYLLFCHKKDEHERNRAQNTGSKKFDHIKSEWLMNGKLFHVDTFFMSFVYIFLLWWLFLLFGAVLIIPLLSIIIALFCTIFPLFLQSDFQSSKKEYNFWNTLKYSFQNKMSVIMAFITLIIVNGAYSSYKVYGLSVALLACLFLKIFTKVYDNIPHSKDDNPLTEGLVSTKQLIKLCEKAGAKISTLIDESIISKEPEIKSPMLQTNTELHLEKDNEYLKNKVLEELHVVDEALKKLNTKQGEDLIKEPVIEKTGDIVEKDLNKIADKVIIDQENK